jgi:hypothetical protein
VLGPSKWKFPKSILNSVGFAQLAGVGIVKLMLDRLLAEEGIGLDTFPKRPAL